MRDGRITKLKDLLHIPTQELQVRITIEDNLGNIYDNPELLEGNNDEH